MNSNLKDELELNMMMKLKNTTFCKMEVVLLNSKKMKG